MNKIKLFLLILTSLLILPLSLNAAEKIYKIGVLLPLSGDLKNLGQGDKASIEVAISEANKYFPKIGNNLKFQLIVEDSQSNPDVALEKLKLLQKKGIKVVMGPVSSTVLLKIKNYARQNNIILVSGSTAPNITSPQDTVLRFQLNDSYQAKAYGHLIQKDKIQKIYFIVRNDVWGNGLYQETKKSLKDNKNIIIEEPIFYDANNKNFNEILESLNQKIKSNNQIIGVHLISYEEGIQILALASNYEKLSHLKWYGNDVLAKLDSLLNNPKAAQFANKVNLTCSLYNNPDNTDLQKTIQKIKQKTGFIPNTYSVVMYDAAWVVINSLIQQPDDKHLKTELMHRAQFYHGSTGWTVLDENGDRKYGNYDLWQVKKEKGQYSWKTVGVYQIK